MLGSSQLLAPMGAKGPSRQRLFITPPSSGRNKLHKVSTEATDKHWRQIKQTMDKLKQMCWCFKVFFRVAANLTSRACDETSHALYKMCCVFCWCCDRGTTVGKDSTVEELIRESKEEFYKELTRQSAEELLRTRQNGTFVIRPSKSFHLGVLSVIQDSRIFHLSVRKRQDGLIALGNEKPDEKCFRSLDCLINYYISNYLLLYSEGKEYSTLLLPYKDNKNDVD